MSLFELLIYFVSCSLDYFKSQLGSKKTTFISVAYKENVRKSSIKEPGLKVKFDKSKEFRGGYKDSVGGGKNYKFGARSVPKFFLPPLEIFLPPPRKIS